MVVGFFRRHGRATFLRVLQGRAGCLSVSSCCSGSGRDILDSSLSTLVSDPSLLRSLSRISSILRQLQEGGLPIEISRGMADQRRYVSVLRGRPSKNAARVPAELPNGASELLKSVMGFQPVEEKNGSKPSSSFPEPALNWPRAPSASGGPSLANGVSQSRKPDLEGDRFLRWLNNLQLELPSTLSIETADITPPMKKLYRQAIEKFADKWETREQARALYINSKVFRLASDRFYKFFKKYGVSSPKSVLFVLDAVSKGPKEEQEALFSLFAEFAWYSFEKEIRAYQHLVEKSDMRKPHTWYPVARCMQRKIIYHHGPTNSGKTYSALQAFKGAQKGVYCGPLRLLAVEVYKRMTDEGVLCSLVTGQERQMVPGASHVACTVEMADWTQHWDVAVIDEVQMLNDPDRGWAWTQALLALPATEVHLCGDSGALELVRALCKETGDELVEKEYERFTPLLVENKKLKGMDFRHIQEGDCVVVFSRGHIYQVKSLIEHARPTWKCAVIYGALPQETRWDQAMLFNKKDSEYKVMVATDAIGMGLNLHIRRVIFSSVKKYNGYTKVTLEPSLVKQIAGRAGRRNSPWENGLVTACADSDLRYIRQCMATTTPNVSKAGLFPTFDKLEMFASQLTNVSFPDLLRLFAEHHNVDGSYFLCNVDRITEVAELLEEFPELTLKDRFHFGLAPMGKSDFLWGCLRRYARTYSQGQLVALGVPEPESTIKAKAGLSGPNIYSELEWHYQAVTVYQWLANYFPKHFVETVEAATLGMRIARVLSDALDMKLGPTEKAERPEDSDALLYEPRGKKEVYQE